MYFLPRLITLAEQEIPSWRTPEKACATTLRNGTGFNPNLAFPFTAQIIFQTDARTVSLNSTPFPQREVFLQMQDHALGTPASECVVGLFVRAPVSSG